MKHSKEPERILASSDVPKEYLLTFLTHQSVPSDNNASERAVKPVKTKVKVSGQFKNKDRTEAYTNLHSIVQTARKQNRDPFEALVKLAHNPPPKKSSLCSRDINGVARAPFVFFLT